MSRWKCFAAATLVVLPSIAMAGTRAELHEWLHHLSPSDETNYFSIPRPTGHSFAPTDSSVVLHVIYNRDGIADVTEVARPSGYPEMDKFFLRWVENHWKVPARFAEIDGRPAQITREIIVEKYGIVSMSGTELQAHPGADRFEVRRLASSGKD